MTFVCIKVKGTLYLPVFLQLHRHRNPIHHSVLISALTFKWEQHLPISKNPHIYIYIQMGIRLYRCIFYPSHIKLLCASLLPCECFLPLLFFFRISPFRQVFPLEKRLTCRSSRCVVDGALLAGCMLNVIGIGYSCVSDTSLRPCSLSDFDLHGTGESVCLLIVAFIKSI